jgi:hypothetical protein
VFGISKAKTIFAIGLISLIANFIFKFVLRSPDVADFALGLALTTIVCGLFLMARDERRGDAT